MKTRSDQVKNPETKGSDQHLPLKSQPGDAADEDHAKSHEALEVELAQQVKGSDANTKIADELRDLADDTSS